MFAKTRTSSRSKRKSKTRKSSAKRVADVTWQLVGMITIIIILMTLAFGDSYQASNLASDNFLNKSFSELLGSLESCFLRK